MSNTQNTSWNCKRILMINLRMFNVVIYICLQFISERVFSSLTFLLVEWILWGTTRGWKKKNKYLNIHVYSFETWYSDWFLAHFFSIVSKRNQEETKNNDSLFLYIEVRSIYLKLELFSYSVSTFLWKCHQVQSKGF